MTQEEIEAQYIKAFNNGYLLEKHEPTLLANILKSVSKDTPYLIAMQKGQRQLQKEKLLENIQQMQQGRDKSERER